MALVGSSAVDPKGPVASEIAELWWAMLVLGTLAFAIFFVVLARGLIRRGRDSTEDPTGEQPRRFLVLGGVVLPVVLLVAVMVHTVETMQDVAHEPGVDRLRIEVVGNQWWWEIRYPDEGVVTANEVHMPVGRPVEFILTSADVIHSFWIPPLGGKLDLLPEDVNTLVLTANEPGVHRSQCSEFCGLQHANMGLLAIVQPPEEFEAWLAEQRQPARPPTSPAAIEGRNTFLASECATCHTIRGTSATGDVGPDLTHLMSRRTIAAATLRTTPEDLARWVHAPQDVKPGSDMPTPEISDEQIEAVLAYLRRLD